MNDAFAYADLLRRWQQTDDDELLVETEWIAGQIAQAVEKSARVAMEAQQQDTDAACPDAEALPFGLTTPAQRQRHRAFLETLRTMRQPPEDAS